MTNSGSFSCLRVQKFTGSPKHSFRRAPGWWQISLDTSIMYLYTLLVAEFGGTLGLFLGFSFMTLWDGVQWAAAWIKRFKTPTMWTIVIMNQIKKILILYFLVNESYKIFKNILLVAFDYNLMFTKMHS